MGWVACTAAPTPNGTSDVVLREAEGRLSVPSEGTMRCVQNRARLVRALYERLDRLDVALTQAKSKIAPSPITAELHRAGCRRPGSAAVMSVPCRERSSTRPPA
ncbi:hypothetical protein GCM10010220_69040 [Streptomyces parvulus]|nr:hypothetical protein GCM10010220_69040 [Streptomyces parvulus]